MSAAGRPGWRAVKHRPPLRPPPRGAEAKPSGVDCAAAEGGTPAAGAGRGGIPGDTSGRRVCHRPWGPSCAAQGLWRRDVRAAPPFAMVDAIRRWMAWGGAATWRRAGPGRAAVPARQPGRGARAHVGPPGPGRRAGVARRRADTAGSAAMLAQGSRRVDWCLGSRGTGRAPGARGGRGRYAPVRLRANPGRRGAGGLGGVSPRHDSCWRCMGRATAGLCAGGVTAVFGWRDACARRRGAAHAGAGTPHSENEERSPGASAAAGVASLIAAHETWRANPERAPQPLSW